MKGNCRENGDGGSFPLPDQASVQDPEECEGGGPTLPVGDSGKGQSELGRTMEGFEFRKAVKGGGGWWRLVEGGGIGHSSFV